MNADNFFYGMIQSMLQSRFFCFQTKPFFYKGFAVKKAFLANICLKYFMAILPPLNDI